MRFKLLVSLLLACAVAFSSHKHYKTKKYHHKHSKGFKRNEKFLSFKHSLPRHLLTGTIETDLVPAMVDLTAKVSPPEDQEQCGSCYDFSLTKALRSAFMLANADPGRLAFNFLLDNCGGAVNEDGCQGGDFPDGQNFLNGNGPWLESQDPYQGYETRCKQGLKTVATALDMKQVGDGNTSPSFQELASAINQGHMLSIDVAVCGDWESYSSGIFDDNQCGAESINHMIDMTGYNCETSNDGKGHCVFNAQGEPINGDGYLIVENNWNTTWGEGGYMRTRAHVDGVATDAFYFDVVGNDKALPFSKE